MVTGCRFVSPVVGLAVHGGGGGVVGAAAAGVVGVVVTDIEGPVEVEDGSNAASVGADGASLATRTTPPPPCGRCTSTTTVGTATATASPAAINPRRRALTV
jgi:hypothetical protein